MGKWLAIAVALLAVFAVTQRKRLAVGASRVADLIKSGSASAKGLSNAPANATHARRLEWLAEVDPLVTAILREKWPKARRTSAYRSPEVNKAVDGSPTSLHAQALALDYGDGATTDYLPWLEHLRRNAARLVVRGKRAELREVLAETSPPHLHLGFWDPEERSGDTKWLAELGTRARGEKRKLQAV